MHRGIRAVILTCTACMALAGCSQAKADAQFTAAGSALTILQATDLHYLSPALQDGGTAFTNMMNNGDGKNTEYSREILDALTSSVIAEHPAAFLLSGDITFNGERQSLEEVRDALRTIEASGVPVLVIPGNHDIDNAFASAYTGAVMTSVDQVSEDEFKEMMKEFGWQEAISADSASFSYVDALTTDTWIMALDANTSEEPGAILPATLQWMEEQLQKAQKSGIKVITMSHQNVLKQNDRLYEGYVIDNYQDVNALLKKYGVTLNLSGHSHLQHTSQEDGLTDICTESLAVYPLQYGSVVLQPDGSFAYCNESLGILQQESRARFEALSRQKMEAALSSEDIPADIREKMIAFACEVNLRSFTGEKDLTSLFEEEGWTLWQKYGASTARFAYLKSIQEAQ